MIELLSGAKLKELREAKGLTQQKLADAIGVSRTAIYQWEAETYQPEGDNLINLARALGVSAAFLLGETDDPAPAKDRKQRLNVGINLDDPEVLQKVLSDLRARKIHAPKVVDDDPNNPFPGETEPIMPPQVLLPVINQDACAGAGFD